MHKSWATGLKSVLAVLLTCHSAGAWHQHAHRTATLTAIKHLPEDLPSFFRGAAHEIAHHAVDPDLVRDRSLPQLRAAEGPEHYFDLELLKGKPLPETRYQFIGLCQELQVRPERVGLLPYALVEHTQRLMIAFAEHRHWPKNRSIHHKCLARAGTLAHYAQDACQPLHVTIHYDGRVRTDGSSPRSGIHQKMDALIDRLGLDASSIGPVNVASLENLTSAADKAIRASNALVDEVYAREAQLPPLTGPWSANEGLKRFAEDRLRAATNFTASLILTAWRRSVEISLPDWLDREDARKN